MLTNRSRSGGRKMLTNRSHSVAWLIFLTRIEVGRSTYHPNTCSHFPENLIIFSIHYYKNVDLSRLGNRCCPGFPTGNACPGQKGVPFCPGCGNRDKRSLFFFMFFFSQFFFYFNYTFAFQLNLCIGIQCV